MDYAKFLTLARKYKGDQATSEVKFLELLVAQEADVINWRSPVTDYKSWSELLREEGLCTVTTYKNYKRARELLSSVWIAKFGVYASISISKLDEATRTKVLAEVKKWYGQHRVTPTYQRISKYVRNLGAVTRKLRRETKVDKLRAHIVKCHALLKKHNIPLPEPLPLTKKEPHDRSSQDSRQRRNPGRIRPSLHQLSARQGGNVEVPRGVVH